MKRPFLLGLTGSIGMGKTTTAKMFAEEGIPVWGSDATVHALYAPGGAAVGPIGAAFPEAVKDGAVDREKLRQRLQSDRTALPRLEEIVHPLTARSREEFIQGHADADLIVLDVPLLFEAEIDRICNAVLVVSVHPELQRQRVLDRGTMSAQQLEKILLRQLPDSEKRQRADYVIETRTLETTREAVKTLIRRIRSSHA